MNAPIRASLCALAALALSAPAFAGSTVKASSELVDDDGTRRAALAFDGLLQTSWMEGEDGSGAGAWIEVRLDKARSIESVSIWAGDLSRGRRSLREHARPKDLTLTLSGTGGEDVVVTARVPDLQKAGPRRLDVALEEPVTASTLRIAVDEVYDGFVEDSLAIAEVGVNYTSGEVPSKVDSTRSWATTSAGERSLERGRERTEELFDVLTQDDEDREALDELISKAADGLDSLRSRAGNVPYGFRVHAIPSDEVSIQALLKLKNPNGIPGVELASTRAKGRSQEALVLKTQMFYAYQELLGGPAPVPNWGREGWEVGALRGFGEPLGMDGDSLGQTYVADVGNHRVQRFDDQGVVNGSWGACDAPDIANRWFGRTRVFHVSGCLPSEADGGFVNPLDVAVMPGKEGDGFAVLDSSGRVQLFGADGQHTRSFATRLGSSAVAGVGGQGFLEFIKGRLVVVLGDEVGVYTMNGSQESTFVLEYGGSSGAVGLKNGKLALIHGRDLVMYSLDGFDHGPILAESSLGTDFEYWDVALDEKKRLWVLTDSGRAIKYKKPGKIDWEGTYDSSGGKPRFHVVNGVVFVLVDDAISVVDTGTGS